MWVIPGLVALALGERSPAYLALSRTLPEGVAALAAACLGVSQRIADSAGDQDFQEVLISSTGGHVAMYMAGNGAVLVLLADHRANVARLHHEARRAIAVVARVVAAAALTFSSAIPEPSPAISEPARW